MSARRVVAIVALFAAHLPLANAQDSHGNLGEEAFRRACASCHVSLTEPGGTAAAGTVAADPDAPRPVPRELLRQFTPETVLLSLTSGKMQIQGSVLNEAEKRAVSEFATGKRFGEANYGSPATEKPNLCASASPVRDPSQVPSWNGWGNDLATTRFQPKEVGRLTAADLPRLKLKWAFGYTNVSMTRAQPAVIGERLYVASNAGQVYALNAKTGCTYWTYTAKAQVVTALSVGPYTGAGGKKGYAVYFGDRTANVYALDANTGEPIWTRKVDDHRSAGITGAPTLYDGRLFVPVQGIGEEGVGATGNYPCCTFRGSVVALNANDGEVLWKTYTVDEPRPRGKTKSGVQLYGPAGGGIWAAPTVDVKRRLVYVATGNGYADPPQPGTDALIAMDLETGAIKWIKQVTPADNWAMGCPPTNADNPACPAQLGPDFDFSAAPSIARVEGRDIILVPQKSGMLFAFDPDREGEILWQYRYGKGSGLGGQWGGAIEGDRYFIGVGDFLSPPAGGMRAIRISDGKLMWEQPPQPRLCEKLVGQPCSAGQGGALTAIPGAVLNAGLDGGIRAYSTKDGSILWTYDANREFETVNGVKARGGGMDHSGPVVVDGMMYVNSGYGGFVSHPGNVLLAFGVD